MRQLTLQLGERSYRIAIAGGLAGRNPQLADFCEGDKVLILSNHTVGPLYRSHLASILSGKKVHSLDLPDGEQFKDLAHFAMVIDYLAENQFHRNDTLIALGGGVIGDMGGFAAASYQRGMGLVQYPTSLLAQVDSSVGGKTAVNHTQGKNLIGAFYQPAAVFIDPQTLQTLPEREYYAGFGEIIKYAILGNAEILQLLKQQSAGLHSRDAALLTDLIAYCCQAKADVVAADETEQGSRALLNLGHTFGHALEKVTGYGKYLHGEAVAIGTSMALAYSAQAEIISSQKVAAYRQLLVEYQLPIVAPQSIMVGEILTAMQGDKKNTGQGIRLVLPRDNDCVLHQVHDETSIAKAIASQMVAIS